MIVYKRFSRYFSPFINYDHLWIKTLAIFRAFMYCFDEMFE